MAEDERVADLPVLWKRLAARWTDDPARGPGAERLRRDVIALFNSAASSRPLLWLNQALALLAWQVLRNEVPKKPASPEPDILALRDSCRQLRQRLEEEQRAGKSRLLGLLQPSREQQVLLADLAAFLNRCQDAFTRLSASAPAIRTPPDKSLEQQIEQALTALPPAWPPARLTAFLRQFTQLGTSLGPALERGEREWRPTLAEALADQSENLFDALVLARGILECCEKREMPATFWPALTAFARELLPAERLQIELIRRSDQPADWFESIEADVAAPRVERVGLAIRAPQRPWFCFPRGRMLVPRRTPGRAAAEELLRIATNQPALANLAALGPALLEASTAGSKVPAQQVALDLLDALAAVDGCAADIGDAALIQIRRWCAGRQLDILPADWQFAVPTTLHNLASERPEVLALFRSDVPLGTVFRVRRFGVRRGDELLRACAISVSAGPAPEGFAELEELVKNAAEDCESALFQKLKECRTAALAGTLEMTAVQFYVDFWGDLGEPLRQHDPQKAREFAERLAALLHRNHHLFAFTPAAYQDHPDGWVQRIGSRQMDSGRVRRVVRPGLQDEQNHLRVPALVEVE